MNEYAIAILKARPRLEQAEEKLQAKLERLACGMCGETTEVIDKMLEVIDLKRQLTDIAEAYRRIESCLTGNELTALTERLNGEHEESIAEELGVCRNTVRITLERAGYKCDGVITAMKKSGLDPTDFAQMLSTFGGLKRYA